MTPDSHPDPHSDSHDSYGSHYDVVIIGGGQAGVPLAHALAEAGKRVTLAERKHLGGSCVNFGCTPTKAALASARVAELARRGAEFGLSIPEVTVDFAAVLARAKRILMESRTSLEENMKGDNPSLLRGHARLRGKGEEGFRLSVGEKTLSAKEVVLDTGTRSLIPPVPGLESVELITAETWLDHEVLPEHLVIMGGGYIGVEMSQFYRRMGSRVTVVDGEAQILSNEDEDVAGELQRLLESEGIAFNLGQQVAGVLKRKGGVQVELEGGERLGASHLFVATGREPNSGELGLDTVGLETDDKGFIPVDDGLRTKVPGLWAAGDLHGGPMFTHSAFDDYLVLESQLVGDGARKAERLVPYAVFTEPELGRVGMSEREAREKGKKIQVARYELKRNSKAREIGAPEGVIKLVMEGERLLGAAVLAVQGAELVHLYLTLMNMGTDTGMNLGMNMEANMGTNTGLKANTPIGITTQALHIHPTLSEALKSALQELG